MTTGRRKLTAVDDPLASVAPARQPQSPTSESTEALYVRLPLLGNCVGWLLVGSRVLGAGD